jgi:hypothetical protein
MPGPFQSASAFGSLFQNIQEITTTNLNPVCTPCLRLHAPLEHVPKKLLDFFDEDMLQLIESGRFLFDQMIPSDREAL